MRLEELTPEAVHERGQLSFGQPRAIRVARSGARVSLLRAQGLRYRDGGRWQLSGLSLSISI